VNASFVKRILLPLHDWATDRPTLARLAQLERSQWWTIERLRDLQVRKLRRLLTHAWNHCPFYRRQLAECEFHPADVTDVSYLTRLPLLDKQQIRDHRHELRWVNVPGGLRPYNTGGSTGRPLLFDFDLGRQAYDQAARMRTHRWFGADVGEKEVYLWGSPVEFTRQDRLKNLRDRLTNQLLLSAFNMSASQMDSYLDRIEAYNPRSLFGYPSSISLLCEHALRRGRKPHQPNLRIVFVTGEKLHDHQRQSIERTFHVPVADGYGSREGGFIAHECPAGSMHITSENIILEILGADGAPVPIGQLGEIVITHLDTYGMPFIRYRTGDMGRLSEGTCPCGRGLERMRVVEGRQTDMLIASDDTIMHALSLIYVLRSVESVRQFRIHQRPNRDLIISIVGDSTLSSDVCDGIERDIRKQIGPGIGIEIVLTDSIEPTASGKHRYVVSEAPLPVPGRSPTPGKAASGRA